MAAPDVGGVFITRGGQQRREALLPLVNFAIAVFWGHRILQGSGGREGHYMAASSTGSLTGGLRRLCRTLPHLTRSVHVAEADGEDRLAGITHRETRSVRQAVAEHEEVDAAVQLERAFAERDRRAADQ